AEGNIPQDKFICSVCLDLLKDPVTIPCGHSYCMSCITNYWNQDDQRRNYSCPQCRQTFTSRPALNKNTRLQTVSDQCYAGPEDVKCDVCTERKYKAVKSCLECLNSYCQNHLQQHEQFFHVNKHNLMDPTRRLNDMICTKHRKHLEIYCRTDQECICYLCTMDEHKNHDTVTAVAERTEKLRSAQTAVEDSERIFTELIRSIERSRSEVTQLIRDQEKTAVSPAEGVLKRLEQEIDDLRRRDTELEQLLHTDNHIHFLKVTQLRNTRQVQKSSANYSDVISASINQLMSVNEYIRLSDGNTAATNTDTVQQYPDHPDRFDGWRQVLCSESVCGRCYWEVERSCNVNISVSYKSISRKGQGYECVFGFNDQSWSLLCSDSRCCFIHNNKHTNLPVVSSSCRIGVYVDHRAGILSFYGVSDTMTLIHRVQTTFTHPLYPGFTVYDKSTVKVCRLTKS
ncbi:putative tripartite motif-containing protein 16-like, partial [Triplophysa rosa]